MLPKYEDILDAVGGREPLWWDEHGVPRFAPFHPRYLGVYDTMAVLAEVTCQSCDKVMLVGLGRPKIEILVQYLEDGSHNPQVVQNRLEGLVKMAEAWGDPPRHDCPGAGETMSARSVVVVETWTISDYSQWRRRTHKGTGGTGKKTHNETPIPGSSRTKLTTGGLGVETPSH